MDISIATESFILTAEPHLKRVEGFLLNSLSIDIATEKYYYDLKANDVNAVMRDMEGFNRQLRNVTKSKTIFHLMTAC